GKALTQFFNGEFSAAWETGKQAASDIIGLDAGKEAAVQFAEGWNGAMDKGQLASDEYTANKKSTSPSVNGLLQGDAGSNVLGDITPNATKKGNKEGLNVGEGSNGIRSIVMNLDIKNYFNKDAKTNVRKLADEIVGHVNDRMRDAVINLG
ncbi:MAG TPA: hypothetical protein DHV22_08060, partial [Xanthomarina gelatinilytica]|nr:hypothetical protein [Xanthomarina gelatinilytica]